MMKKIIKRTLIGLPAGMLVGYVITLLISLVRGEGEYFPVVPAMAERFGSELNAVLIQTGMCALIGAVSGGATVIWESERLGILAQTVIHYILITGSVLGSAYVCEWCERTPGGILFYLALFTVSYIVIWLSLTLSIRAKLRKINEAVAEDGADK